jgi:hypothetical protein
LAERQADDGEGGGLVTAAELLRTAAANITKATWRQNPDTATFPDLPTCVTGHIWRIDTPVPVANHKHKSEPSQAAKDAVRALARATWRESGEDVTFWNDAKGRRWTQVRALCLRVAEELEARQ